ncbi:hypothetical protein [Streptomyces palmae]|uniref:Uncharacterized protein n=1 Tax=Streptomyces palmae TaxID=1701085 RepID=A0A4Z0HF57_9ACTN|nr:hypothetical protein [Streptomyces palmae]TGB17800.1 hypothetical protein E4099_02840 [Streptomyces palmae]
MTTRQRTGHRPVNAWGRTGRVKPKTTRLALTVYFIGCLLAGEVHEFVARTQDWPLRTEPGLFLLVAPLLGIFLVLPVMLVATGVLRGIQRIPWTVTRRLERRGWWTPLVAAVAAVLPAAVFARVLDIGGVDIALVWAVPWAALVLAAVLAGVARRRVAEGRRPALIGRVWAYGALAVCCVFGLGSAAFATGLVDEYRPPRFTSLSLPRTWTDGEGGSLFLTSDGGAVAENLGAEDSDRDFGEERCTGYGTWNLEGEGPWGQRVRLAISGCRLGEWAVSGTRERPKLNYEYGDPDSPDFYVLR